MCHRRFSLIRVLKSHLTREHGLVNIELFNKIKEITDKTSASQNKKSQEMTENIAPDDADDTDTDENVLHVKEIKDGKIIFANNETLDLNKEQLVLIAS